MAVIAVTGKQFTVTVAAHDYSAQVTDGTVNYAGTAQTAQTLTGSASWGQGVESTAACNFLYDGGAGFYAALVQAATAQTPVAVEITGKDGEWTGDMIVSSVSAEYAADGVARCSAEFTGSLTFAAVTTP